MARSGSGPIAAPEHFPVTWVDPQDEQLFWVWDQVHHPHPKTPLSTTFELPACAEGSSRGFQAISVPLRFRMLTLNGYTYNASEFLEETNSFPPPWWGRVEQEFLRRLPNLMQTWEQEYLPEVLAMNRGLIEFDYGGASTAELLSFIDTTHQGRVRAWDLHMQTVIPVMGAATRFSEMCEQVLGAGCEPYLMLQGFENKSVESGKALWRLSRQALQDEAITALFAQAPIERLARELERFPAFWSEVQGYLDEYGWRGDAFELADPAWKEDPAIALSALRDMIAAPDENDPSLREAAAREERERLVQEAREQLDGQEAKPIFELTLGLAQQYLPIQENHNFYIDQQHTVLTRRPFLELGRRLADAGAIAEPDDVFYLEYAELAPAATGENTRDWKSLVAERRAERERWTGVVPPRELGTRPPRDVAENPIVASFYGQRPEPSQDPKVINGIAASAGTVTATARVVRTLAEANKLQPGDVLVCEMTMPAWTPLFASVSAVVSDSGGVLSHCAIVAREYRIPCVVGTEVATQTLKDGQRITVDGSQGIVRIEG